MGGRWVQGAIGGVVLGAVTFVGAWLGWFFSLVFCDAENQQHHPSACTLIDHHQDGLLSVAVVGASAAVAALALLGAPRRAVVGAAVAVWLFWAGYFGAIMVTLVTRS